MSSATIASKQPNEKKPLTISFANALSDGETISNAVVTAYEWNDQDVAQLSLALDSGDYATADQVEVRLLAGGTLLGAEVLSLAAAQTVLLIQGYNDEAWTQVEDLVDNLGWDTNSVWFDLQGGVDGHTYKFQVRATTSSGHVFEYDVLMPVEEL